MFFVFIILLAISAAVFFGPGNGDISQAWEFLKETWDLKALIEGKK